LKALEARIKQEESKDEQENIGAQAVAFDPMERLIEVASKHGAKVNLKFLKSRRI
jgi:hypothetical protein